MQFKNLPGPLRTLFRKAMLLIGSMFLLGVQGCDKDESNVPHVNVDITINIDQPSYQDLRTVGGWLYLTGGSKGLIVYRRSQDEFKAYDRHCTYRPEENCDPARVDSSDIKIVCDDCHGSVYSITDGTVIKGPASQPLREYSTHKENSILRITN